MIFSLQQLFSNAQAITATADSSNVIDLGVAGTPYGGVAPFHNDKGKGTKVPLTVQVVEDFNTLTSLTIEVQTGATEALGTHVAQEIVPLADLVAGKQFNIDVLPNQINERYVGIVYTVVGTPPTTGKITAGISMGSQTNVTGV